MEHNSDNRTDTENKPTKSRGRGYVTTVIGADIGFIIGALAGFLIVISQINFTDIGTLIVTAGLATLAIFIVVPILGAIGGLVGAYTALSLNKQQQKGKTIGFLALLYPIPLLLAGSDLFIGALIIPLLARWLAVRNT